MTRAGACHSTVENGEATPHAQEGCHFARCSSLAMLALERIITEIAPTDIPVLLVGEPGTGKEVLARRIHQFSARRNTALMKVSCASMRAETLLAGHDGRSAIVSAAVAGTVFFDELSDLDAACQRKLLSALPDGEAVPDPRRLRARVISATTHNLKEEVHAGRFRSELYYRINGVCLQVPPLRQRKEDIPVLLEYFLGKYAALFSRPKPSLPARTLEFVSAYPWPGNIRELENTAKKIVILGDEQVVASELEAATTASEPVATETRGLSLKEASRAASRQAERELILKTLARTRWNRKRAAQELQVSYKSLLYKVKQIGADDPEAVEARKE